MSQDCSSAGRSVSSYSAEVASTKHSNPESEPCGYPSHVAHFSGSTVLEHMANTSNDLVNVQATSLLTFPPPFRLIESLGVEMMLHIFACFCKPIEILRLGEAALREHEIVLLFPVSLARFPLNCRVRVRDTDCLLHAFDMANRADLTQAEAARVAGQEGIVVGKHPTNGIGVLLAAEKDDNSPLWLEPMCLMHVGNPALPDHTLDKRLFFGQKVRVKKPESRWHDKVGTVDLVHELAAGVSTTISVRFAGQVDEQIDLQCLEAASSFFGRGTADPGAASLSLQPFFVGLLVRCRSKDHVLAAFDQANRDDYFEYMDEACGQIGVVDALHATNGIRVRFPNHGQLWFEPPCLEIIRASEALPEAGRVRLLVGQRVRLNAPTSPNHRRVGLIQLHFHERDYSKITVRFPDGCEAYMTPDSVELVNSIY